MKIRCIFNFKILHLFKVEAITLYPWILFAKSQSQITERLFRHELEHIYQVQRVGWLRFYSTYLKFYIKHRIKGSDHQEAYSQIPYEIQARTSETIPLTTQEILTLNLPPKTTRKS